MKKLLGMVIGLGLLFVSSLLFFTCYTNEIVGTIKLSVTDKPADANFEKIMITFSKIEVSKKSTDSQFGWINLNNTPATIDLLTLNNGKLQELGVKDLAEGTYNQIRFYVTDTKVTVGGVEYPVHCASNTFKLVSPFTIQKGITTELVVDFDASRSIKSTQNGKGYTMTPVTRLASIDKTGAVKGMVTPISDVLINVSIFKNGETQAVAGTTADADGNFLIGYLEPGRYNITIEAIGFKADTTLTGIVIEAGKVVDRTSTVITLMPLSSDL